MNRRSEFIAVLGHEMHVSIWGARRNPALVMWHGLARTGRDFDELAMALSDQYFVICPDTIGRGFSSWSSDPMVHYQPEYYANLALALLDEMRIERVHWLGTSMGGLIGMHLAAGPMSDRILSLIINDIGPDLPKAAVARIADYVAELPEFGSFEGAENWLREVYAPFGPAPDSFWKRMAKTSMRRRANGALTLHYDPRIVDMLIDDPELWGAWRRITTPTHVLRGAHSDILPKDMAQDMASSGPCPSITTFPDCGHAPSLSRPEDASLIRSLLSQMR